MLSLLSLLCVFTQSGTTTPARTTTLGLGMGLGERIGKAAHDVPPRFGLAINVLVARRYAVLAGGYVALGAEGNFSYARHSEPVQGSLPSNAGPDTTFDGNRLVSANDFSLLQTATLVVGPVRPWLGAGAGLELGYFSSPEREFRPGELRSITPQVHAALGIDAKFRSDADADISLGLRAAFVRPWRAPGFSSGTGGSFAVFGDRLQLLAMFFYGF